MLTDRAFARLLVFLQAVVLAGAVWSGAKFPFEAPWRLGLTLVGGVVILITGLQLGRSLTPIPIPNGAGLRTGGLYQWVRHPMYLGVVLVTAAFVDRWVPALWFAALLAIFWFKIEVEEHYLRHKYPEYRQYQRRTWRLVPYIW